MLGTEFEELALAEPQLGPPGEVAPLRVLVLGAGLAGLEAARMAAARGHDVEVWERAARPGGQMHLAVAAPDKTEVWPAWTYRWDQAQALGVRIRCGVTADAAMLRVAAPDHVIVATGARPRPLALPGADPLLAWAVLADPGLVPEGSAVAVIGGGIVGVEVAEILAQRRCTITVLEAGPALAPQMARNNRTDTLLRLRPAGVAFHTKAMADRLADGQLHFTIDGAPATAPATHVIAAIGALPERGALVEVEASGLPFTLVGDANEPGDFLSVLRDAMMTGFALGLHAQEPAR